MTTITRRRALAMLAGTAPLLVAADRALQAAPAGATLRGPAVATRAAQGVPGIVKPLPPEWFIPQGTNAETRWEALADQGFTVPNERFFVRNHTATPIIDPASWRLLLTGTGLASDLELTYDDLRALPSHTTTAVIECAGNGRRFFADQQGTPASGTQWRLGAVGAARWRGVRLSVLLRRAGLLRGAVDVMPEGLDAPVVSGGVDRGHVRRPLPIAKALDDVLVAYEMNGEPLPADHGFPARLVVPGWVGIASVKWLGRIEVSDQSLSSFWSTDQYRMVGPDYPADSPPLTSQPPKSAFELPWDAQLPDGTPTVLHGRSWSGLAPIHRVEVSTDGGAHWQRARLHPGDAGRPWTRWSVPWPARPAGSYQLLARARDRAGTTQPDSVPFNQLGYQYWAVVRHAVTTA